MKKITFLIIYCLFAGSFVMAQESTSSGGSLSGSATSVVENIAYTNQHYTLRGYDENAIILLMPRRYPWLSFTFLTGGTTASGYALSLSGTRSGYNDCVVVNSIYFGYGGKKGRFQPAGTVTFSQGSQSGTRVVDSTVDPNLDPNLAVKIWYNSASNRVFFSEPKRLTRGMSFFSGPMIVSGGVVNPILTEPISHWSSKHYRTFLIQRSNGRVILGITTKKMSLTALGEKLVALMSPETISVVNLDGGSSTSLWHQSYTFNPNKILPAFFGLCGKV